MGSYYPSCGALTEPSCRLHFASKVDPNGMMSIQIKLFVVERCSMKHDNRASVLIEQKSFSITVHILFTSHRTV